VSKLQGKVASHHRRHHRDRICRGEAVCQRGCLRLHHRPPPEGARRCGQKPGSNVAGVQGDISKLTDLDRLHETIKAKDKKIDILFANAGVAEFAALGSITEEHFDKLFNINVKGTLFTVQKILPLMNDGGSIILTGSVASTKGTASFWVYGATKPPSAISCELGRLN